MMLGPAGEAYFVGEEVSEQDDNPYLEYEDVEPPTKNRQSRKDIAQSKSDAPLKKRSSSEGPQTLQGAVEGSGIDLKQKDLEMPGGYFL